MLLEELPNARLVEAESIFEWRINPGRLDDELAAFVDQAYATEPAEPTESAGAPV